MPKCALFLSAPGDGVGLAVADGLRAQGFTVSLQVEQFDATALTSDLIFLYGPMVPLTEALGWLRSQDALPPTILWCTEQPPDPELPAALTRQVARMRLALEMALRRSASSRGVIPETLLRLNQLPLGRFRVLGELFALQELSPPGHVVVFTQRHADYYRHLQLNTSVVPFGYHPMFGNDLYLERPVDILFLGSRRDRRRQRITSRLMEQLNQVGLSLTIRDGSSQYGYVFGHERTVLLNQSKIVLNISRQPWDDIIFRAIFAATNGAVLVTEKVCQNNTEPFVDGVHFISASLDHIVDCLRDLVGDKTTRTMIAQNSRELLLKNFRLEHMIERILQMTIYGT